ncbi:MAG: ABC transporter substrate-binding protein [Acidobacteriota bacterium]
MSSASGQFVPVNLAIAQAVKGTSRASSLEVWNMQRLVQHRAVLAVALAGLVLAACSNAGTSPSATSSAAPSGSAPASAGPSGAATLTPNANYKVTLVVGQNNDPFFVTMASGAAAEAKKLGITFDWQGPTNYDPTLQIPILSSVLSAKPQFLIVSPTDANALVAPLKQFGDAGIPVLNVDTDVSDTSVRLGLITSDNKIGGKLAAQELAKILNNTGKVALLCVPPGITTGADRKAGFEAEIKTVSGITYVGSQIYNGSDTTDATRVMNAILAGTPDLNGVVACDGFAGLGAATAIKGAGKAGTVKLVSFDAGPDLVAALKDGTISALMIQRSADIGAMAVDDAVRYLNGDHSIPQETLVPYVVGTKDNIDTPDVQKYLFVP